MTIANCDRCVPWSAARPPSHAPAVGPSLARPDPQPRGRSRKRAAARDRVVGGARRSSMLAAMSEPIVSPIDGQVAYEFDYLDDAAALATVEQARAAQRDWRRSSITERANLCLAMLTAYERHAERYAREISTMMGKPLA